ncbi:MAG: hypothetical protein QOE68_3210 [Thermoanaerobaculia bacterium]|nr:hypothetical protein [Thermoanaerobaculia bacterium]
MAPDSVRVWRGIRLTSQDPAAFFAELGSIFIPVTTQLQRLYGLTAYLPTVMPANKPSTVPDEIALVFYSSQAAYTAANAIVVSRTYQKLHSAVFAFPQSTTGFPVALPAKPVVDTPYFMFPDKDDWYSGFAQVYVGSRKNGVSQNKFVAKIGKFLNDYKKGRPKGLGGAIAVISGHYVILWEHWTSEDASLKGRISDLAKLSEMEYQKPFEMTPVVDGITAHYAGLTIKGGECLNMQFGRIPAKS